MTPTLRVLLLSSGWRPRLTGGAEVYAANLADRLRDHGHTVGVVTLGVTGPDVVGSVPAWPHDLRRHRSAGPAAKAAFHVADIWHPAAASRIAEVIFDFRPDVVHSHGVAGMSSRALSTPSRLGVGHVHTIHDHWLRCWRSTGTRRDQRPCGPACTVLARTRASQLRRHHPHVYLAISESVLRSHQRVPGVAQRGRVVLHPADDPGPRVARPRSEVPTFGFLGQLNPNKGVEVLLAAARRARPAIRLLVAGRGPQEPIVRAEPGESVEFLGWVEGSSKEAFFDRIDCLVVPSVWDEPAGLVVLEAAARGVPVIAAAVGGLPEYVPVPCHRLLFPRGDVEGLARSLELFAESPADFDVTASPLTSWDDHIAVLMSVYEDARAVAGHG